MRQPSGSCPAVRPIEPIEQAGLEQQIEARPARITPARGSRQIAARTATGGPALGSHPFEDRPDGRGPSRIVLGRLALVRELEHVVCSCRRHAPGR